MKKLILGIVAVLFTLAISITTNAQSKIVNNQKK